MNADGQQKRQEIKDRISAAQTRNDTREGASITEVLGEKAAAARDNFTAFAREHPVATVAGGIAVGVLISAMFRNSPTRRAGRYAGGKAAGLAALGSEIAVAFAHQVMESTASARTASADLAHDVGDKLGATARRVRHEAGTRAESATDTARTTARDIGKSLARSLRKH